MSAVERIEVVLGKRLLLPQLTIVPDRGATDIEIRREEEHLGRGLCSDHIAILHRWNGIALEVVRLFGCGDTAEEVGRLLDFQLQIDLEIQDLIVIGSDASGFAYLQAPNSAVFSFDMDSDILKRVANGLDEFFERLVFGPDAATFAGEDWLEELREGGVVN